MNIRYRFRSLLFPRFAFLSVFGVALMLGGCININTRLQPEDASVKEVLMGVDCVPIILGFGFGTATIERAKADTEKINEAGLNVQAGTPITKVRRVEMQDVQFLFFGSRCVEVTGE